MALSSNHEPTHLGKPDGRLKQAIEGVSSLSYCLDSLKLRWKNNRNVAGLWQDWPRLAGEQLAAKCLPLRLSNETLFVGVTHLQWLHAIQYNRMKLLAALRAAGYKIREIKLQQYHPPRVENIVESEESVWERHPSRVDIHGLGSCDICGCPAPLGELALWGHCGFCRRSQLH